ncbi:MAG: FkbM family methyltransferase [Caulobacterales bacterium]
MSSAARPTKNRLLAKLTPRAFRKRPDKIIQIGKFDVAAPFNHYLTWIAKEQPRRDLALGVAARLVCEKRGPASILVDVGANIGATAAIMATACSADLVLVEPSDVYFPYLEKNAARFPNKTTLLKAFVADGAPISGSLHHWNGTAHVEPGATRETPTLRLENCAENAAFLKLDTDGFDFRIICANISTLAAWKPILAFECQVRDDSFVTDAFETFDALNAIGYNDFVALDDQGYVFLSSRERRQADQLVRFISQQTKDKVRLSTGNFDFFFFHAEDADLVEAFLQDTAF